MNKAFWALIFTIFVDAIGIGIILPIITGLFIENALFNIADRDFFVGLIISLYPLGMFIGSSLLGSISDIYGRKKILLTTTLFNMIGIIFFIFGVKHQLLSLLITGRLISGLFAGNIPIAQAAIIDMSVSDNLNTRLSLLTLSNSLGFAFGPLLGGVCLQMSNTPILGINYALLILCMLLAISIIVIFLLYNDYKKVRDQKIISFLSNIRHIAIAIQSAKIRKLAIILFLFILGYFGFFQYMPIYMKEAFKLPSDYGGYMLSVYAIAYTFSLSLLFPLLNKRITTKTLLLISLLLQFTFIALFTFYKNIYFSWLAMLLIGIVTPLAYISLIVLFSEKCDENNRGEIMGIAASLTALAWGLSPIMTGILDDYSIVWPLYACLIVLLGSNLINLKNSRKVIV